jgi:hypothetical protein
MLLLAPPNSVIRTREIRQKKGGVVYVVDQSPNPTSISLCVGGIYGTEAIIAGQCGTISDDEWSIRAFVTMRRVISRHCRNVKRSFVGAEALTLAHRGARLTASVKRDRMYDLSTD